jgi:hypothetical protein
MPGKPNATSFKPGDRANPRGRPKGIKETRPRGYLKRAIDEVMAEDPTAVHAVLRRSLQSSKKDLQAVELIGKVGKELGPTDPASAMKPTVIIIRTNVDPYALEGPQQRAKRLAKLAGEAPDASAKP